MHKSAVRARAPSAGPAYVPGQKLLKIVELSKKGWAVTEPVFSPNGKWLAVGTQAGELHKQHLHPDAAGVEQPQIHLIETATGTVRETLSAPLAYLKSLCFSPDGKTLASGGPGRVLLWDIADLAAGAK